MYIPFHIFKTSYSHYHDFFFYFTNQQTEHALKLSKRKKERKNDKNRENKYLPPATLPKTRDLPLATILHLLQWRCNIPFTLWVLRY